MERPRTVHVKVVEKIIDRVRSKDLVGHLGTQHDLLLVLLNGGSKPGPQFKPMGEKDKESLQVPFTTLVLGACYDISADCPKIVKFCIAYIT
jgi:hypothetical protein